MNNNFSPKKKQFVCLSGLPRTGSTLLSAILSQNPKIHAEGNSAVCQLMWDTYLSCTNFCAEQLLANNRQKTVFDVVSSIPSTYYKDILEEETIILDKCRSWTLETNVQILENFVDSNVKIIILERPIIDIVKSFAKLYKQNGRDFDAFHLFNSAEPLMRSKAGVEWAKKNNEKNTFLFIQYQELVEEPQKVIEKIYEFCGWEAFEHSFERINVKYHENDAIYQLAGQHVIREKIGILENLVELSQEVLDKIALLESE
jgi:sulfotransferase